MFSPEKKLSIQAEEEVAADESELSEELKISLDMEQQLGEIQTALESTDLEPEVRTDLEQKQSELLEVISKRAKKMFRDREIEQAPGAESTRIRVERFFKKEGDRRQKIQKLIEGAEIFFTTMVDKFPQDQAQTIRESLAGCLSIEDDGVLVDRILEIIEPVLEFQRNNPVLYERLMRQEFSNGAISGERFIPIEGTDDIIVYGMSADRVHLHLAPMRTLTNLEKFRFVKEVLPAAMRRLAKVIEENPDIKLVTASSYIVAANPELFTQRIGFTKIGPLDRADRLKYFSTDEMPVLRATMTREEFLSKYL